MKHKNLVFLGRFQPFHNGHLACVKKHASKATSLTFLLGQGYDSARNPFSFLERRQMILDSTRGLILGPINVIQITDHPYSNDQWILEIANNLRDYGIRENIGFLGAQKDESSWYIKYLLEEFPRSEFLKTSLGTINATDIRGSFFQGKPYNEAWWSEVVPNGTIKVLNGLGKKRIEHLKAESHFNEAEYKDSWLKHNFPLVCVTTDALVTYDDYILLIQRGRHPGLGKWALPGGYLQKGLTLKESCLNELLEETGISLSRQTLKSYMQGPYVFDSPYRADHCRIITNVFTFHMGTVGTIYHFPKAPPRPKVKAGDDARKVKWVKKSSLHQYEFYQDHLHIIKGIRNAF